MELISLPGYEQELAAARNYLLINGVSQERKKPREPHDQKLGKNAAFRSPWTDAITVKLHLIASNLLVRKIDHRRVLSLSHDAPSSSAGVAARHCSAINISFSFR